MDSNNQCRKCSAVSDADLVLLWDGHMYCSSCLDAANPLLADYAMNHPVLSEELPERIKSKLPTFWTVSFQLLSVRRHIWISVVIMFLCALTSSILTGIELASLFFILFVGMDFQIVYLFYGFILRPKAEKVTLCVTDGVVEISRDGQCLSFPLASSLWTDGSTGEAYPLASVLQSESLLLVIKKRSKFLTRKSAHAMCGFDRESRERWLAFLRLAEIPVHRPV